MARQIEIHPNGQTHTLSLHPEGEFISDHICDQKDFFERSTLDFCRQSFDLSYVLDIGANIGNHACFFSQVCGSKVIAIEPIPSNFELLTANCPTAFCLNIALSRQVERVRMAEIEECLGNCTVVEEAALQSGQFKVGEDCGFGTVARLLSIPAIPLDVLNLKGLTFIKLDVEGLEFEVLAGAKQTLGNFSGVLMVEIHRDEESFEKLSRGRFSRESLLEMIAEMGFHCIYVDGYSNHFFTKAPSFIF